MATPTPENLERISTLLDAGALVVHIQATYGLEHAGEALSALATTHVRGKLAPYEYPKEIEFIDALPMTTTGKVQRRLLRERETERKSGSETR